MEYEFLFFTSVANEDKVDTIKKELAGILTSQGANILGDFSDIGKRKLAYPIKRNTHAFFSFVHFELDDEKRQNIPEINKLMGLNEKVMRHLIVRADEVGKPVSVSQMTEAERPAARVAKIETAKPKFPPSQPTDEAKPAKEKAKSTLSELDEKLSEILEETPE